MIHGSYGQSAVLMDDGRLSAVLDFDRSAQELLGLDLAYALRSFASTARSGATAHSLLVTGELTSLAKRLAKVAVASPGYVGAALGMLERLDGLARDTVDGIQSQRWRRCRCCWRPSG